ncbi:hypothetical protein AB1Y20_004009 [Prymnesium parvum]|uniref:Uncharacterized protein n=1 Tax=Prymnesium parvum TaxID=97485 RepID=A0AB34J7X3_PRYPA
MVRPLLPPPGVPKISIAQKAGSELRMGGALNSARQLKRDEVSERGTTDEMKDRPGRQVQRWNAGGELALKEGDTARNLGFRPATAQFDYRHLLKSRVSDARLSARRASTRREPASARGESARRLQITRREVAYRAVGKPEVVREVEVVKATTPKRHGAEVRDLTFLLKNKIGPPSQRGSRRPSLERPPPSQPACLSCPPTHARHAFEETEEEEAAALVLQAAARGARDRRRLKGKKVSLPQHTEKKSLRRPLDRPWQCSPQEAIEQSFARAAEMYARALQCLEGQHRALLPPPAAAAHGRSATAAWRDEGIAEEEAIKAALPSASATAARRAQGRLEERAIKAAAAPHAAAARRAAPPYGKAEAVRPLLAKVCFEPRVVASGGRVAVVARPRVVETEAAWSQRAPLAKIASVTRQWAAELAASASDLFGVPQGKPFVDLVAYHLRTERELAVQYYARQQPHGQPRRALAYSAPAAAAAPVGGKPPVVRQPSKGVAPAAVARQPSQGVAPAAVARQPSKGVAAAAGAPPSRQPSKLHVAKEEDGGEGKPEGEGARERRKSDAVVPKAMERQPSSLLEERARLKHVDPPLERQPSHAAMRTPARRADDDSWVASLPSSSTELRHGFEIRFGLPFTTPDVWREMAKLGQPLGIDLDYVEYSFDTPGIHSSHCVMLGIRRTATFTLEQHRGFTRCECTDFEDGQRLEWVQLETNKCGLQFIGSKDIIPTFGMSLRERMPGGAEGTSVRLRYTFASIDLGGSDTGGRPTTEVLREHLVKSIPEAWARDMLARGYEPL